MDSPSGTHQEPGHPFVFTPRRGNPSNRDAVPASDNSMGNRMAKKHNLGIATDWTAVEQSVLEEVLSAFASESNIIWYAKIAMQLQSEMEWDAALQCRRMSRNKNRERRKDDHNLSGRNKDEKKTSGTHQEPGHTSSSFDGGDNPSNRNISLAPDHSGPAAAAVAAKVMKHNPGIAMDWTTGEQSVLEEGLRAFASDTNVIRYAKIAMQLENKTVRDVALRCRWMSRKENSKRKKEGNNLSRKTKDRKEKGTEPSAKSSQLALQANAPPHVMPMIPVDFDDGKSSKANGVSAMKLLENNAQAFNQIAANFSSLQIEDNISLFCQARDNLQVLLNSLKDEPEAMKKMPPLPDKLNEEMINSILHPPARPAPRQP